MRDGMVAVVNSWEKDIGVGRRRRIWDVSWVSKDGKVRKRREIGWKDVEGLKERGKRLAVKMVEW